MKQWFHEIQDIDLVNRSSLAKKKKKKRIPLRNTTVDKSVQRISSSKMAREIYVSIGACCLACFRYTSVTKYTGKWNVVWALQFSRSGVWISCEAFMTQFQPTTFIMTCKRGVGITVSMQREPLGTTFLFVSPFLIDVTPVYPSRSFSLIERMYTGCQKRKDSNAWKQSVT